MPAAAPAPKAKTAAAKIKEAGARKVSVKSKTGDPACASAMSDWVTTRKSGTTPASVFAILGQCRAKARALRQGKLHREAGNEAKAQRLEALAAGKKGPITAKDRLAKAKELVAARKGKVAASQAPAVQAPTAKPARKSSLQIREKTVGGFSSPERTVHVLSGRDAVGHHIKIAAKSRPQAEAIKGIVKHQAAPSPFPWDNKKPDGVSRILLRDAYSPMRLARAQVLRADRAAKVAGNSIKEQVAGKTSLKEQAAAGRAAKGSAVERIDSLRNRLKTRFDSGREQGKALQGELNDLRSAADRARGNKAQKKAAADAFYAQNKPVADKISAKIDTAYSRGQKLNEARRVAVAAKRTGGDVEAAKHRVATADAILTKRGMAKGKSYNHYSHRDESNMTGRESGALSRNVHLADTNRPLYDSANASASARLKQYAEKRSANRVTRAATAKAQAEASRITAAKSVRADRAAHGVPVKNWDGSHTGKTESLAARVAMAKVERNARRQERAEAKAPQTTAGKSVLQGQVAARIASRRLSPTERQARVLEAKHNRAKDRRDTIKQNVAKESYPVKPKTAGDYRKVAAADRALGSEGKRGTPERLKAAKEIRALHDQRLAAPSAQSRIAEQKARADVRDRAKFSLFGGQTPNERPLTAPAKAAGRGTADRLAKAAALKAQRAAKSDNAPVTIRQSSAPARGEVIPPRPSPAKPTLREQADAGRAAKGTTAERVAAIRSRLQGKAADAMKSHDKAKAAYAHYNGNSVEKAGELRRATERAGAVGVRLNKASARVQKVDQQANPEKYGYVRGSEKRIGLAKEIKARRSAVSSLQSTVRNASETFRTQSGNLTRKKSDPSVRNALAATSAIKAANSANKGLIDIRNRARTVTRLTNAARARA